MRKEPMANTNNIFPLDDFVNAHNKSAQFSLNKGANYRINNPNVENLSHLPMSVQDIISIIKSAESNIEKAAIAHVFANQYIESVSQWEGERKISFEVLAQSPYGDCDDFVKFKAGLLLLGGVEQHSLLDVTALVRYSGNEGQFLLPHALLFVEEKGHFFVLDNNLDGIYELNPAQSTFEASFNLPSSRSNPQQIEATVELVVISSIIDATGTPYESADAFNYIGSYSPTNHDLVHTKNKQSTEPSNLVNSPALAR